MSKLRDLDVKIPDALQIGAILSKLPPSWSNYRKKVLQSFDTITLEQFKTHLQIECETHARDVQFMYSNSKVNNIMHYPHNKAKYQASGSGLKVSEKIFKKKNNKPVTCFHCGKKGHVIRECRFKKAARNFGAENSRNTNLVEEAVTELVAVVSDMQIGMIIEANMGCFQV